MSLFLAIPGTAGENRLNTTNVNQLFDALSSLYNVREMHLSLPQLCSLPNIVFRSPSRNQTIRLERLVILSRCLVSISSYAFYELSHLRHLTIGSGVGLRHLSAHAFDIAQPPPPSLVTLSSSPSGGGPSHHHYHHYRHYLEPLTIDLRSNQLTESSLEPDAFAGVGGGNEQQPQRSIRLQLGNNNLTRLRAEYLKAFLDASQENVVHLQGNQLECDCEVYWLLHNRASYINQVHNAICSGYINLWMLDEHEFSECATRPGYSPRFIFRNSAITTLSISNPHYLYFLFLLLINYLLA